MPQLDQHIHRKLIPFKPLILRVHGLYLALHLQMLRHKVLIGHQLQSLIHSQLVTLFHYRYTRVYHALDLGLNLNTNSIVV